MAQVMMRCPTSGKEFDTGVVIKRKSGLRNTGLITVLCPHCNYHHHLRQPHFSGDNPADYFPPADGLETAPAFAMEVGIIIAGAAFMEAYIPQIVSKVTGADIGHSVILLGVFPSTSTKISVLQVLQELNQIEEVKDDLGIIIKKFRDCSNKRNEYAHAKYYYSGGQSITLFSIL